MDAWEGYLENHKDRFLAELFDFIRIPSVSAQPEHSEDVRRAAVWVKERLDRAGLENAEVMATGGHPVVYADWLHAGKDKPTVLIYGHFDVQPADPLELWHTSPFEPTLKDGIIYARGASDDKGGMLTSIIGAEAILKTVGRFAVNLKFCYEGQEEIGSPELGPFLMANKDKFACDVIYSADGLQWSNTESMIVLGLKGLAKLELSVKGPASDLHSGLHGGVLQNPLEALAKILASLRDNEGKIVVEGFFDDVLDPSQAEREDIANIPFDEEAYRKELNVPSFFGEPGFSTRERNWIRPTLDINGIWGGYQGGGSKTVIPSEAHAKITCRLVANQDPNKIVAALKNHIEKHTPAGVRVTMKGQGSATPFYIPAEHPGNILAKEILTELYGKEPYYTRLGGSIPISGFFKRAIGADMIGFGWSLASENLHAPNEFFPVENFYRGQKGYCMLLERLGEIKL